MEVFKLLGKIVIDGVAEAEKALGKVGQSMETAGKKLEKVGDGFVNIGKKLAPVSVAAGALGGAAVKSALEFEDSMAQINTLLDDSSHLDSYSAAVKSMSNKTGIDLETMAAGMYQAISSLGDGGEITEKIFSTMANAAKAGGAEVSDSVALISSAMKGYNSVNDETAQKISDLAFQTAKLGVTTFPEMAKSMQPLFPIASSLNVSYEELFGSMATLTGVTGNTAEVSTQLKAVFSNLMTPTKDMSALIEKYGYSSAQAMLQQEGLAGVMAIVQHETGGQADKMAELFSSVEAVTAVTALTGAQFDTFNEKLVSMTEATGATSAAYEKLNTNGDTLRTNINLLKNTGVELGTVFLEMFAPAIEKVSEKVTALTEWFSGLDEQQKEHIATAILVVAAVTPVVTILGKTISTVGTLITTGGKLLTFLTGLNPTVLIIVASIGALVAIGVSLYKNWDEIKTKAVDMWEKIKTTFQNGVEKLKSFLKFEWSLPKLKMPHFTISGAFSLSPPSVPHFGIEWYRKAMDNPVMFTKPTLFDFNPQTGQARGAGEAGDEIMLGRDTMLNMIGDAVSAENSPVIDMLMQIYEVLQGILAAKRDVVLDSGAVVGTLTPLIDTELGAVYSKKKRGL